MQHLKIVVKGRVQGVYFRLYTQKQAQKIGVKGTVRNRADGSVEILAAAKKQSMQAFVQWCHKGPVLANVSDVEATVIDEAAVYQAFEII